MNNALLFKCHEDEGGEVENLAAKLKGLRPDLDPAMPKDGTKNAVRLGKIPTPQHPRPILLEMKTDFAKQLLFDKKELASSPKDLDFDGI